MASTSKIIEAMNNVTLEDEEDEEDEIIRPYGPWMRAPLRRQTKMIGAKWLRDGGGNSRNLQTEEPWSSNKKTNITPQNQEMDGDGENQGNVTNQEVMVLSYSKHHIDVVIETKGWSRYRLTDIYGEPDRAKMKEKWELICRLHSQMSLPWVLIGDMNNVISQNDKRGGRPYPTWLIRGFQKCIDDCDLHDLEIEGYPYTWEKGYGTDGWMEIRLDRALVSNSFMDQFVDAKLINMKVSTSDHSLIILVPFTRSYSVKVKRFRFENAWLRDPMCGKIVEEA
ncbi:hypothetical protein POM88_049668 [Heracleum sosnowskyi]|uniref:Endonuclease/exonuclease/phosphatase domain-containing protein n=1 Tax=Heracleum sosnowskyi TaxID=360622 RepID=A0AAD8GYA1_9APIA|nr:hypothetical protein POM88_049668 [Heracleum sosnowskyi]